MHAITILSLGLSLAIVGVSTTAIPIPDINYSHFASHEANLATTDVDLTPWGYHGGQLPKSYSIIANGTYLYQPSDSYALYQRIISGKQNLTSTPEDEAKISGNIVARGAGIEKKCETMNFDCMGIFRMVRRAPRRFLRLVLTLIFAGMEMGAGIGIVLMFVWSPLPLSSKI